jgi:hypothetical protein
MVVVITWTQFLDPGRWMLHHWIAPPGFNLGCRRWLGAISGVVVIYGTEYTLPHFSHANNEQCMRRHVGIKLFTKII